MCLVPAWTSDSCSNALSLQVAPVEVYYQAEVSGGTAPYTYSWTFGDPSWDPCNSANTCSSTSAAGDHIFREGLTYTVDLTVTDAASHVVTVAGTVAVQPMPQAPITVSGTVLLDTCGGGVVDQGSSPTAACPQGPISVPGANLNIWVWWRPQGYDVYGGNTPWAPFGWGHDSGGGPNAFLTPFNFFSGSCTTTNSVGAFSINTANNFLGSNSPGYVDPQWVEPYGIVAPDGARYTYVIQVEPYNPAVSNLPAGCTSTPPSMTSPSWQEEYFTSFSGASVDTLGGSEISIVDTQVWPSFVQGPSAYFDSAGDYTAGGTCSSPPCSDGYLEVGVSQTSSQYSDATFSITPMIGAAVGIWTIFGSYSSTATTTQSVYYPTAGTTSSPGSGSLYCNVQSTTWTGSPYQSTGTCSSAIVFLNWQWYDMDVFQNESTPTGAVGEYAAIVQSMTFPSTWNGDLWSMNSVNPTIADPDGLQAGSGFPSTSSYPGMSPLILSGNPNCQEVWLQTHEAEIVVPSGVHDQLCTVIASTTNTITSTLTLGETVQFAFGPVQIGGFTVSDTWTQTYSTTTVDMYAFEINNPSPGDALGNLCYGIWQDTSANGYMGALHVWPMGCPSGY